MWKRNCPKCNKELFYTNLRCFNNSTKVNRMCAKCGYFGNNKQRKIIGKTRICPKCNNLITHKSEISCYHAIRRNKPCYKCTSKLNYDLNRKKLMSHGLKYKTKTNDWHNKIANNRKLNGTYKVTPEVREKHKINKINRMIENGTLIWPNYNINACNIFQKLDEDLKLNGIFALKGKEYRVGRYWVDYYEPNKNIVIEYDEEYHYDKNGNLKDKDVQRQLWIENRIKCKFYRINKNTDYAEIKNIILCDLSQ